VDFYLQAEDGIRDGHVTGVQTCALPILELWQKFVFLAARSGPMGERASPHAAATLARDTNFCHSSTWIRSDARASIPAFRNALAIRSTRSLVRPSGSPTTTI